MSSSEMGRLTLNTRTPGMHVSVLDSALRPVTTTSGWLRQEVPAGVYRIEGRVGLTGSNRLVTVSPGEDKAEDLSVEFAATAPTDGTTTTNETHGELAWELTRDLGVDESPAPPSAGIALILRNLRPVPTVPQVGEAIPDAREVPLKVDQVALLDEDFRPVEGWGSEWRQDHGGNAMGRAARLDSGAYVLRTLRDTPGGIESVDQTIWLSPGWVTLVFIPNMASGPEARGVSVHMSSLGSAWSPGDGEARATEAALTSLRDGTASVGDDTIRMMLEGKFTNPMLGIIGLHVLLQGRQPDPDLVDIVVGNLRSLVGDHPDVLALSLAMAHRPGVGVSWPPMLYRSYSALLRADQSDPDVIPSGSMTERIAVRAHVPGPWLQWTSLEAPEDEPDVGAGSSAEGTGYSEGLDESGSYGAEGGSGLGDGVSGPRTRGFDRSPVPARPAREHVEIATERVKDVVSRAVEEIADFLDMSQSAVVRDIGVRELAHRTGLPTSLVANCLEQIDFT